MIIPADSKYEVPLQEMPYEVYDVQSYERKKKMSVPDLSSTQTEIYEVLFARSAIYHVRGTVI